MRKAFSETYLRCRGLANSHYPQIRYFAIPIGLAIGEFIDAILQEFYLLDDPSFCFLGTEAVGHGDDD